jgi:hypothetical protein
VARLVDRRCTGLVIDDVAALHGGWFDLQENWVKA